MTYIPPTDVYVTEDGNRHALIAGTIRNLGAGWFALTNTAHQPANIHQVITYTGANGYIEIIHDIGAVSVLSSQACADETFTLLGYRCGISVGLTLSRIYIAHNTATTKVDPDTLVNSSGNFWIEIKLRLPALE